MKRNAMAIYCAIFKSNTKLSTMQGAADITNEIKTALIICISKVSVTVQCNIVHQSPQRIKPHLKPDRYAVFTQATANCLSVCLQQQLKLKVSWG